MYWLDSEMIKPEENVYVFCQSSDKPGLFKAYWSGTNWYDAYGNEVQVEFWKEYEQSS